MHIYAMRKSPLRKSRSSGSDLVKVSFRVPAKEYEEMLFAVKAGKYSSLSELVRHALERLILEYRESFTRKSGRSSIA